MREEGKEVKGKKRRGLFDDDGGAKRRIRMIVVTPGAQPSEGVNIGFAGTEGLELIEAV